MFREIIFCAFVFCGVQRSESAITGWSGDGAITGATGTITTTPLLERSAVGATVVTLTAASTGSVTGYTFTGSPVGVEIATPTTGVVTLTAQVNYETTQELVFEIIATDDDSASTGTATVTVPIGDVGPFTTVTKEICAADGTGPGVSVGDVSATGVTVYTTSNTNFDVDQTTGDLKTASGVTLAMATTPSYTVLISGAATAGAETNILTVTVTVKADCSGKEIFAASFASLLLSLFAYSLLSL